MAFSVADFISKAQDGARPTLFVATINWPIAVPALGAAERVPFLVKATSIPEMTLGVIEVPFMGRVVKVAGDRTFSEWNTTVINDDQYVVRAGIENWNNAINGLKSNGPNFDTPLDYRTSAQITQFNGRGVPIRVYNFENLWPQTVGSIDLAWDSTDTIEEFEVTWAYDWFTSTGPTGDVGTDIGDLITSALG